MEDCGDAIFRVFGGLLASLLIILKGLVIRVINHTNITVR